MNSVERLASAIGRYFEVGDSDFYICTRDKSAFAVGTMKLEDFVEVDDEISSDMAEWLDKLGVFLPACKPGDKAYFIIKDTNEVYVSEEQITDVSTRGFFVNEDGQLNPYEDIGKTVFLNPEEAYRECQKIRGYDFEETCPYCDFVNEVVWDGKSDTIICAGCGAEILLCNNCETRNCGSCQREKELSLKGGVEKNE